MRENCTSGSVAGAPGNRRPYAREGSTHETEKIVRQGTIHTDLSKFSGWIASSLSSCPIEVYLNWASGHGSRSCQDKAVFAFV